MPPARPLRRAAQVSRTPPAAVTRAVLATLALATTAARAETTDPTGTSSIGPVQTPPAPAPAPEPFHVMSFLAGRGLHDLDDEVWNAYGQITDIYSLKLGFAARYTNLHGSTNSLLPSLEGSFTETATFYLGARLWHGAEAYLVPEIIAERPLSHLAGLGGMIQNFELQKTGNPYPAPYLSRAYVRQTFGLGGATFGKTSDQAQLARVEDRRRIVITAGNFSILDFFDKNSVTAGDMRRSFFNMAFMTHASWDFAADARGYAWGAVAEVFYDDFAFRIARITPPKAPNQLALDFRIFESYGDQVEVEHTHRILGHEGTIRVLGYRNVEPMARFDDAIAAFLADPRKNAASCQAAGLFNYGSTNASAPDLCWARRTNVKLGIGLSYEQHLLDDLGVFVRAMYSDGNTEVFSFTSTDRSLSVGAVARGPLWKRPLDSAGAGWAQGFISSAHARYLGMGGVDGFVGDGKINQASECGFDLFYSLSLGGLAWFSADYQHIWNPGFNADRGPVNILGGRVHVEL